MMTVLAVAVLSFLALAPAELVKEPRSGITFTAKVDDMSLVGLTVRCKTIFSIKVYAIGIYVADTALPTLPVPSKRHEASALYQDLLAGEYDKEIILKPARNLSANQIRGAFRGDLADSADPQLLRQFLSYLGAAKVGDECVLRWTPDGTLKTTVAGIPKPPISDRPFARAVLSIWLGKDSKRDLVSPAGQPLH